MVLKQPTIGGERIVAYEPEDEEEIEYYGRLVWYSIGKLLIPVDDLKELYKKHNLDIDRYFPNKIRPVDVFKVATKEMAETGIMNYMGKEVTYEFMVRPLTPTRRRLVRELRVVGIEGKEDRLEYIELGEWQFNAKDNSIISIPLVKDQQYLDVFNEKTQQLQKRYETLCNSFTDKQIRDTVRKIIYSMPKIPLRKSGSIYFIPKDKENIKVLEALSEIMNEINSKYGLSHFETEIVVMPVITTEPNRKMIIRKFQTYVRETISSTLKEISEILADPNKQLHPSQYAQYVERYNELKRLKQEYTKLLEEEVMVAEEEYKILSEQLAKLMEKVKVSETA